MITIVSRPVFLCPHRRLSPTNQTTSFETQMIPMTPQVLRRTLRQRRLMSYLTPTPVSAGTLLDTATNGVDLVPSDLPSDPKAK
jgi:hypothetical protein